MTANQIYIGLLILTVICFILSFGKKIFDPRYKKLMKEWVVFFILLYAVLILLDIFNLSKLRLPVAIGLGLLFEIHFRHEKKKIEGTLPAEKEGNI